MHHIVESCWDRFNCRILSELCDIYKIICAHKLHKRFFTSSAWRWLLKFEYHSVIFNLWILQKFLTFCPNKNVKYNLSEDINFFTSKSPNNCELTFLNVFFTVIVFWLNTSYMMFALFHKYYVNAGKSSSIFLHTVFICTRTQEQSETSL